MFSKLSSKTSFSDFPPAGFKGKIFRPAGQGYAEACRIPNVRGGNRPALIARCFDADDVVLAVKYCDMHNQPLAVRSGGHGIDGYAMPKNAFVIDTTLMKKIEVDPVTGITTVAAGVILGEMDAATQEHGYVVPAGTVSETGVAGLILGGGFGYLTRRFGLTVDNLLSVNVMTVDGQKLMASETENPELFWGLCGAGHNLAIATSFTYQAQKIGPQVMSGYIIYRIEDAVAILSEMDKIMRAAPLELSVYPVVLPAPPLPGLPEQMVNFPLLVLIIVFTGEPPKYEEAMTGIRGLGDALVDMVHHCSWLEANSLLDVLAPPGRRQHSRGGYLKAITPTVAATVADRIRTAPAPTVDGPSVAVAFHCLGGAMHEHSEESKAFSRENASWMVEAFGQWVGREKDVEFVGWIDGITP
ncbi:putative oxidoreductase [Metarhizium anisopliae]